VAVLAGDLRHVRTFQFLGARDQIKYQSTQAGLNMLRLILLERSR